MENNLKFKFNMNGEFKIHHIFFKTRINYLFQF